MADNTRHRLLSRGHLRKPVSHNMTNARVVAETIEKVVG
jgi:hypothetical protein